jgi:signal transduction histidine kinase/CheY-like chemotaxis protein
MVGGDRESEPVQTEAKAHEDELVRLRQELEETNRGVVALYAELDEQAGRLRQADEQKSRFLSNVSHELRTPLSAILALTRLLLDRSDGGLTAEQEKQVTFINQSARELHQFVTDLLDLAKIEAGKITVRASDFEVVNLFAALRGMFKPLITGGRVAILFDAPSRLPTLATDENKVAQILRNFISNALKFTERGEIRVRARLNDESTAVMFSVSDTGIGIAPAQQALIFEEFVQVENRLQQRTKGTGLGLPLTRLLAELLGGSVAVRSEPDRGSVFLALIPVRYASPAAPMRIEPMTGGLEGGAGWILPISVSMPGAPAGEHTPSRGRRRIVLVIDDDRIARYIVREWLPRDRYALFEADNGREGIRLAAEERPDLIVLDLVMPGMDGFEVLDRLKADPVLREIPILIRSSKTLDADERATLGPAVAVLSKDEATKEEFVARADEVILAGRPKR